MAFFALAAGHGGSDPGAVNGERYEKNDNLRLCLAVEKILIDRGHKVVCFRRGDSECPAAVAREWFEKTKADFSICFHRNSFSSSSAQGVEVWSFEDELSKEVSERMSMRISERGGFVQRGRKKGGAAWISPNVPCAEPEVGFISNVSDNDLFDKNFQKIAEAVADSLEEFFPSALGEKIAEGETTSPLNIRTRPYTTSPSLGIIPMKGKVDIYSVEKGWAKVSYDGKIGYSSTTYMKITYPKKEDIVVSVPDIKIPHSATEGTVFQILGRAVEDIYKSVLKKWEENK